MRVAILGTGRMGAAMAGRLAGGDFEITVWNRSPDKAAAVGGEIGAAVAGTPAEAASGVEVILASLADDDAVREVHLGSTGTLHGIDAEQVILETSTVDPSTVQEVATRIVTGGGRLLDSPVSGSVALVEQGSLTAMVGGDSDALDRARPVLERLTKAIFHLGPVGAGATMKLAVNSLVHATNLAISEALVLAERAGIDRSLAYEVFAAGAGASPFLLYKRQAFEQPEDTPVAFSLDLVKKDLALILGLAARLDVPMDQLGVTSRVTDDAIVAGHGADDMSALAAHLRESPTPG